MKDFDEIIEAYPISEMPHQRKCVYVIVKKKFTHSITQ